MDLNSLKDTVSNLTLYDIKAGVRKVQNAVMNYTEMEAKVREATNNEPWGASSTLMQEIATGTFSYQTLNEIMPMVYRRFTEKSAEEWRQIYKSLQLLEFLVKHGSERVVDDARSHLTLLKMLRQFHFIDQNGKDQGINVRNRAKELADLLSDVDRIRAERKKARANKGKYTGVGNTLGGGLGGGGSSSHYGGFGSDSAGYGGYSGGVYGDGGGFGGEGDTYNISGNSGGSSGADRFEAYDEYDEGEQRPNGSSTQRAGTHRTTAGTSSAASRTPSSSTKRTQPEVPPKAKAPEVDLFSFDEPAPSTAPVLTNSSATAATTNNDDDDFDDFQEATAAPETNTTASSLVGLSIATPPLTTSHAGGAQFVAPKPVSAPQQVSLTDMMGLSSISPPPASSVTPSTTGGGSGVNYSTFHAPPAATATQPPKPATSTYHPVQPNYFQSVQVSMPRTTGSSLSIAAKPISTTTSVFPQPTQQRQASSSSAGAGMAALRPVLGPNASASVSTTSKPPPAATSGGDAFGSLWSQASTGIKKTNTGSTHKGPSMGQLAQEKSQAAIWGTPAAATTPSIASDPVTNSSSNGLDDLLG